MISRIREFFNKYWIICISHQNKKALSFKNELSANKCIDMRQRVGEIGHPPKRNLYRTFSPGCNILYLWVPL